MDIGVVLEIGEVLDQSSNVWPNRLVGAWWSAV